MKKITDKVVYKCDHCSKVSLSAGGMRLHEISCKKNPDNWTPCVACDFCSKERILYDSAGDVINMDLDEFKQECLKYGDVPEYHIRTRFICQKDGASMYHNKILRLHENKRAEIISNCDKMMPRECKWYNELLDSIYNSSSSFDF